MNKKYLLKKTFVFFCVCVCVIFSSCTSMFRTYIEDLDTHYLAMRNMMESNAKDSDIPMSKVYDIAIPRTPDSIPGTKSDSQAESLPARVYIPIEKQDAAPLIIYIHGGGFVLGSYKQRDEICRSLATLVSCPVISVGYSLAPEHPYPDGLNDVISNYKWILENVETFGADADKIIVAGESAGATLATALSMFMRDSGGKIPFAQVLFAPAVGPMDALGTPYPSRIAKPNRSMLSFKALDTFAKMYAGPDLSKIMTVPYINPIMATSLVDMPQTLLVSYGLDPLRDEDMAYAKKLADSGVKVITEYYPDKDHAALDKEAIGLASEFIMSLY